jgi:ribonucleoside-diphosphate reductase alpha chain
LVATVVPQDSARPDSPPAPPAAHFPHLPYPHPNEEVAQRIFLDRYALRTRAGEALEDRYEQAARRVAKAIALGDGAAEERFLAGLLRMELVPGGRVLAGAGLGNQRTLSNCFLVPVADSRQGIVRAMMWATEILALGGGVGFDFTPLRAAGAWVEGAGGHASGPVSFITAYNALFHTIEQGGSRRAACMGMLSVDHPDVRAFVHHKAQHPPASELARRAGAAGAGALAASLAQQFNAEAWEHFNVSVQLTDGFLGRLDRGDADATALMWEIAAQAHASGDPGLFFIDRANDRANGRYYQRILGTNPCGEIPLAAFGTCNLLSLNLKAFLRGAPGSRALDWAALADSARTATVFLDNVLEVNHWPIPEAAQENARSRKLGLGCLGWADALVELGVPYGSDGHLALVHDVYRTLRDAAYAQSADLAAARGPFGAYDEDGLFSTPYLRRLEAQNPALGRHIRRNGLRNVSLLTQAPTGTISLLSGANSGIEPFFDRGYKRHDRVNHGAVVLSEYALDPAMVTANELSAERHVRVQAAAQEEIDQSISKTVNMPHEATVEDVKAVYDLAVAHGLKGVTVFRDGCRGGVLERLTMDEVLQAAAGRACANGRCEY